MFDATSAIGSPFVVTSNNGGLNPEQVAELCVNRLIQVSDTAPPELAQQARAFRQQMLAVVLHYVRMAVAEDRTTVCTKLEQAGFSDLAQQVRKL
jgi:glycerol uptake facilitator-like aquaporin